MAGGVKITDLVDQSTIDKINELNNALRGAMTSYVDAAKEMAKGLDVTVKGLDDIERLQKLQIEEGRKAAEAQARINEIIAQKNQLMAQTTPVISRRLMEQERLNKAMRDEYRDGEKVKEMVSDMTDSYEGHLRQLVKVEEEMKAITKARRAEEAALASGSITQAQYTERIVKLTGRYRELAVEKSSLNQLMKIEEKLAQDNGDSYNSLSHQLELLKNTYKTMSETSKQTQLGQEMERAIQELDAHLKDMAADMGEFQRNVGNYAIAGRDGVVTTESVTIALSQQAVTIQDVVDQTKILEEARQRLDTSDENYGETLDKINERIAQNKARLADVSDIMDRQATSVAEAEAQNKRFEEAIRHVDLSAEDSQEQIDKLNERIAQNKEIIDNATPSIKKQEEAMREQADAARQAAEDFKKAQREAEKADAESEDYADSLLEAVGLNGQFGSSLQRLGRGGADTFLHGLTLKVKAFGSTLLGLLSNPVVLGFLGIGGVVAGFKMWYDYNKGLVEATRRTADFTGLSGDSLKAVRDEISAVAESYDKEFQDVLEAANAVAKQFGISMQDALAAVEDGFIGGADANGEFLENLKEYPAYFKEAGLSAREFIAITTQANQAGIYSDKGIDVIKEANLRIREMSKSTASALDAIGISSAKVQKALSDGSKTTFDIMQEVSAKMAELPASSAAVGAAIADVFGGPGEDAGLQYILTLKDIDTNLDNVKDKSGELGRIQQEQLESQIELQQTVSKIFDYTGGSFEGLTASAQTFVNKGIIAIIHGCVDLCNWFINLYNESKAIRNIAETLGLTFKTVWYLIREGCMIVINEFKALGTIIEGLATLDWDKIKQGGAEAYKALSDSATNFSKDLTNSFQKAFDNIDRGHIKPITLEYNVEEKTTGGNNGNNGKNSPGSGVDPKEAAKHAAELLKILQQLEESKLDLMAEGHQKDLAKIRLNYKKRIDAIKGNSAEEQALRVNLLEQMEKEIERCESDYQKNLAKINLDNALAAVEENSQKELDLRLAKLAQQREAELAEADKTGADKQLIDEKYDKQRRELEEKYTKFLADEKLKQLQATVDQNNGELVVKSTTLTRAMSEELKAHGTTAEKRAEIQKKYERQMEDLAYETSKKTAEASISSLEGLLENEKLSAEDRAEIQKKLTEEKNNLGKLEADYNKTVEDRKVADAQAAREKIGKAISQVLEHTAQGISAINDIAQASFESQISRIEEEQERLQESTEAETAQYDEMVAQKIITEDEAEARKRVREAQTAKQQEALERKKQQLQQKAAMWNKANSMAQAAIATALSLIQLWVTPSFPACIPLMAVVGALGAAQIATIAATPLPKYAKGTDNHPGGLAVVGDGGSSELIRVGSSFWLTPDTPTLVDIPAGASVIPDIAPASIAVPAIEQINAAGESMPVVVHYDDKPIRRDIAELARLFREQNKMQKRANEDARLRDFITSRGL